MYSDKDLIRVLRRNLDSELDAIKFYMDNSCRLNYSVNKKKVDSLIFDSFKHAQWLSRRILALTACKSTITGKTRAEALREESSLAQLYQYQLARTSETRAKAILKKLIAEEKKHEGIVRLLK